MASSSTVTSNLPPSALPKPGKWSKGGYALAGIVAGFDFAGRVSNGEGILSSAIKAGGKALIDDALLALMGPQAAAIYMIGSIGVMAGQAAIEAGKDNVHKMGAIYSGTAKHNKVINSDAAQTMRQRGMAMINQNGEATRSVLGSEARTYFRNSMSQY